MAPKAELSPNQRVVLAHLLRSRVAELQHAHKVELSGLSPAEQARQTLLQDAETAAQMLGIHEVDERIVDMHGEEFDAVTSALHRINGMGYGLCVDCDVAIGFERLRAEPEALRCLSCQTIVESNRAP